MSRRLLSPVPCHSFPLAACGAGTSHLVENLVNRLAQIQKAEQPVHGMVFSGSLPQNDGTVAKLELHDHPRRKSELFAQFHRNRKLPLGRHPAIHHG